MLWQNAFYRVKAGLFILTATSLECDCMSHNARRFGSVTVARARSSADLRSLLDDPWLKADTIVIKPNWVGIDRSYGFTECEALRMLLEALDGRIVITESYSLGRGPPDSGIKFTADGKEVDWRWLFIGYSLPKACRNRQFYSNLL